MWAPKNFPPTIDQLVAKTPEITPEFIHEEYEAFLNITYFLATKDESSLPIFKRARHAVKEESPRKTFTQADIGTSFDFHVS